MSLVLLLYVSAYLYRLRDGRTTEAMLLAVPVLTD